jgi:hypothetical protein
MELGQDRRGLSRGSMGYKPSRDEIEDRIALYASQIEAGEAITFEPFGPAPEVQSCKLVETAFGPAASLDDIFDLDEMAASLTDWSE